MVVDFDQHLSRFQRILMSVTDDQQILSDGDQFKTLLQEMQNALKLCPADYSKNNVLMFLLLNGDANFIDLLSEDENFAHLIDTIPRISQRLILRLIFDLNGLSFLQQLVLFAPCVIAVPLMEIILNSEEMQPCWTGVLTRIELSKACFTKVAEFAICNNSYQKFVSFFKSLQSTEYKWIPPTDQFSDSSKLQAFQRGVNFLHDLQMCSYSLLCDFSFEKCWEGFKLIGKNHCECFELQKKENLTPTEASHECRNIIISKCNDEACKISLDNWLEWAEIEHNPSESYQQAIGRLAHIIKTHLQRLGNDCTLTDAGNLIVVLSPFAIENKLEDAGPADLTFEEIKLKFKNQDHNGVKMLKLLLQHPNVLEDEDATDLIERNSTLLDVDDVALLCDMTVKILKSDNAECHYNDSFKYLLYKVTKHLPFSSMVEVHRQFMDKFAESFNLCTPEFFFLLQEAFNKTAFSSNKYDREWCNEFLRLSILNSSVVMRKALDMGLENANIAKYMSIVLHYLRPISQAEACEWILKISESHDLSPSQMNNFPPYVLELVKQELIHDEDFIKSYALPCLHKLIKSDNWTLKMMWLTSVQLVLQNIAESSGQFTSTAAIVIYLAQFLEISQQPCEEFSIGCVHTRGKILELFTSLLSFEVSEAEQNWLQSVSTRYSTVNQCHLKLFWAHELTCVDFEPLFGDETKTPAQVACILAETIQYLTITEWKGLATTLKLKFALRNNPAYSVFQSYYEAVYLIVVASADKNFDEAPKLLSCLQYIVCCFGDVLKHIVLPALENGNILEALEETLLLFSKLPAELWNRGVMNLLPELVIILDDMSCDEVTVKVFLSILEMCPISDGRALLEAKLRPSSKD